ncbi:MAG: transcription termination/antitermination factor NusG [Armatimonadetes bacterium]|nr:transcription termination/antitermination factor NusG [Armatimonadota bacterium]MBS1711885.1 transcription termination/antitermination factor NusG [Armatimonadota bacterium]MBX3109561.1 transcription termination/antitermination factor NusG [Fimbriimonadaceae bacterium]
MARAWYAVHTISGHEKKVSEMLRRRADIANLWNVDVFDIMIPTEKELVTRNGKRAERDRKVFPGYILVQMYLNDDTFKLVKGTNGVTGFVSSGNRPVPLEDYEVRRILSNLEQSQEAPKVSFNKTDIVRVIEGPFADYTGRIEEVNPDREKVKVMISIFGRDTAVELDFAHVQKE